MVMARSVGSIVPPTPPINTNTTDVTQTQIRFGWQKDPEGGPVTNYDVTVAYDEAFTEVVQTATVTGESYLATLLVEGETHWFRVRANGEGGTSDWTAPISRTTLEATAPDDPTDLALTAVGVSAGEEGTIRLDWTDNSGANDAYWVYRSVDFTTFTRVATLSGSAETWDDEDLPPRASYRYYVVAALGEVTSNPSNTEELAQFAAPNEPENVVATVTAEDEITVTWDAPSVGTGDEYTVLREITQIANPAWADTREVVDGDRAEATSYLYTVTAIAGTAQSDPVTDTAETPLRAPSGLAIQAMGDFYRFTWTNNSSNADEIVLLRGGTEVVRTVGGSAVTVDLPDSDTEVDDEWTVQARSTTFTNSAQSNSVLTPGA